MTFRTRIHCAVALVAVVLTPGAALAARWSAGETGFRSDEILVEYREAAAAPAAKALRDTYGLRVQRTLARGRLQLLDLPSALPLDQALTLLRADPAVALAEPNFLRRKLEAIPDDMFFFEQWGLHNTGQANFVASNPPLASVVDADMDLPRAWDRNGDGVADRTGNGSVTVAIIDDGFDLDHPDLAANFVAGYDAANDDSNPAADSAAQGHGTLVAGALGAIGNNGIGVAGVIWDVNLLPLKVGSGSDLSSAGILAAYDYIEANAVARGIRIVNASYGGPQYSQMEFNALQRLRNRGILFVTSAGNEDSNIDRAVRAYPANYNLDNIVAVAATNRQDNISSFSEYGPLTVDLAAPGLQIVTTQFNNTYNYSTGNRESAGVSGTSFSSPYVAGIAALIATEHPTADYRELKARLIEGAEASGNEGPTHRFTRSGRANAANSLGLTPRPSLVLSSVSVDDTVAGDGNGRLDPGETADLVVRIENLWQTAADLQAELSAPSGTVAVTNATAALATLTSGGTGVLRFTVQVPPTAASYRDVPFTVALSAQGGYTAARSFLLEIAELKTGVTVNQVLSTGLYDEFHTYHFDLTGLPVGHNRLRFRSTASRDIDLLIKRDSAAEHLITLKVNPDGDQIFSTNADQIGGEAGGNEDVCILNPATATYYVTVVNYDQIENTPYTLQAFTDAGLTCPTGGGGRFGNGGGGGGMAPAALLVLLGLAWWQRRRQIR